MPGPNNGRSGRVVIGRARPRPEQPTEKDKTAAIKAYDARNRRR